MDHLEKSVNTLQLHTSLFDDLPVAIYGSDRAGCIKSYNKAAIKLWGREPETGEDLWCGLWTMFYTNGAPMPFNESPMARTLKEGTAIEGEEIIIKHANGSCKNILAYAAPTYNSLGELIGATNTLVDITDHKSDENKQAMLAAIIESSDDTIISKTLDGIITSWNGAAEKLFGYSAHEVIGKHITLLIPPELYGEEQVIIEKVQNSERIDHFETIRVTKCGNKIPISLTVSPIRNSKGVVIGASKIVRDISKQKLVEARLQLNAENMEILNFIGKVISAEMDVESILQKVTDATTQLSGAAFGAFFHTLVNEDGESSLPYALSGESQETFEKFGMPHNSAVFHHTLSGGGIMRVSDITKDPLYEQYPPDYIKPKDHLPVLSYLAVPVISKESRVIGGLFFGHPDVGKFTEEHEHIVVSVSAQAAVALDNAKLYEEIKILNSKKDDFIGMASHELKTPVTSIKGYLQIIERNLATDDKNRGFVSKARQQAARLSTLIDDLLDVSKIQIAQLPLNYTIFNLCTLLTEAIEVMQQNNADHSIELRCEHDNILIKADQQRIEQVMINLISNAIKYSPEAARVIIHASVAENKVQISVQDFGIGIAKDQQERIFSRFYRVQNLAAHISGLGIGLYISQGIVTRHKGKLEVKSTPGKGSTFFFELPLSFN